MARPDIDDLNDEKDEAPPAKGGSLKLILIVALAATLVVGGTVGATLYFAGAFSTSSAEDAEEAGEKETAEAKPEKKKKKKKKGKKKLPAQYIEMSPPFTVNFQDAQATRFLQITVQLMTRDPEVVELVGAHVPVIRNNLVLLFSSQSATELSSREGKEKLRKDALDEVNRVLKIETGSGGVDAIYFTSFVMQ